MKGLGQAVYPRGIQILISREDVAFVVPGDALPARKARESGKALGTIY